MVLVKLLYFCVVINTFIFNWVSCQRNSTIESTIGVAMIVRHGHRTPTGSYPRDPYVGEICSCVHGLLTTKGARELYKSGLIKASRYESLLSGLDYNNCALGSKNVYVRSSAVNRCIVSAESFLDSFLPEFCQERPVYVPDASEDTMITWPGKSCGDSEAVFDKDMRLDLPEVQALTGGGEFVQYVANHSGMDIKSLLDIGMLGDILIVQRDQGLMLPAWVAGIYNSHILPLVDLMLNKFSSSKSMQIKSGVLLNDLLTRFDRLLYEAESNDTENILFYSGHDITVQGLLILLDVFGQINKRPKYASTISLELRYNDNIDGDVEIVIFYFKDEADKNPLELRIPNCPAPCAYEDFKRLVSSKLVVDYDVACNA